MIRSRCSKRPSPSAASPFFRRAQATKTARSRTPPEIAATASNHASPLSGARTIPKKMAPTAAMRSRLPKKSGRPSARRSGNSASRVFPNHHAKMPTGRLIKKMAGHDARSISHEPTAGPNAAASAPNALQRLTASALFSRGNASSVSDKVAGVRIAARWSFCARREATCEKVFPKLRT